MNTSCRAQSPQARPPSHRSDSAAAHSQVPCGQRPQLLLDRLQRTPSAAPPDTAAARSTPPIQPNRIKAGEPANRPRQVDARETDLLAAVTLKVQQHRCGRRRGRAAAPAPVRNRNRKPTQQHVIDAAIKRRRHPRQQRLGDRASQPQRQMPRRPAASRTASSRSCRAAAKARSAAAPERQLRRHRGVRRMRREPLRPAAQRRAAGGSDAARPAATACHAAARSGTRIRHDTPSTARWWIASSRQPARAGSGVKPHRLHQMPAQDRAEAPPPAPPRRISERSAARRRDRLHPSGAGNAHPHRARRHHLERPIDDASSRRQPTPGARISRSRSAS